MVKTGKALSFADTSPVQVFRNAKKLLKVAYRTGAVIVTNSDTAAAMEGFVDDNGRRPLWVDSIKDGQPDRLNRSRGRQSTTTCPTSTMPRDFRSPR